MRELRMAVGLAVAVAMAAVGCGGSDGGADAGSGVDGGGREDSGPPAPRCGPLDGDCDISDPASCGAGMACLLGTGGATGATSRCFSVGTGIDGTACAALVPGQCIEGFACSELENVCRRWCCDDADCNPPGATAEQVCQRFSNGGPTGREVGICVQGAGCSLLEQTGCAEGEACNVLAAGRTKCEPAGTAVVGAYCVGTACVAGAACVATESSAICRAYCDRTAPGSCPGGFVCTGLQGGPEDVGACVPLP